MPRKLRIAKAGAVHFDDTCVGAVSIVRTDTCTTTSSNSTLTLVTAPLITGINPLPGRQWVGNGSNLTMSVTACGGTTCGPLGYQWARNGTNITNATASSYSITGSAGTDGAYSVIVSNSAGTTNGAFWQAVVLVPGRGIAWGNDGNTQTDIPVLTNVTGVAAGDSFSVAVLEDGTLRAWGSYSYGETTVPGILNAVAVAAGANHGLALSGNGTVVAWGDDRYGQTDVPSGLGIASPVKAVAAGGNQSMALLNNGTVVQWGLTNAPVPGGLNDAIAISAGRNHCLALRSNGTIVAWGDNSWGQTNVPAGLTNGTTNVVAIAAGGYFNLALTNGGGVIAWGSNIEGEGIVPAAALANVMSIAASVLEAAAIKNDGTVVTWGSNIYGEQTLPPGLINIKNISVGAGHYLASIFSPLTQYQVDVTKDVLLIYNTNSVGNASSNVCAYYTNNRPMVAGANVLGVGCSNRTETFYPSEYTNLFLPQITSWLTSNPTKRPQYVVLFYDVPSSVDASGTWSISEQPGVQCQLSLWCAAGWHPFVTSINMRTTNDCKAYINKVASFGATYSPGKLIISAGTYGNSDYYFDDAGQDAPTNSFCSNGVTGVLENGGSSSSIHYVSGGVANHITSAANVAGYISQGTHAHFPMLFTTDGAVTFSGTSSWYAMTTVESFNGQGDNPSRTQSNFLDWFSQFAFGGSNYEHTPVAAVSNVSEPHLVGINTPEVYFGYWQAGRTFASCAWNSRDPAYPDNTVWMQAVGDPFVRK